MLNQRTIFAYTHSFGRLARQVGICTAVVALTACGGGDGGSGNMMTITPDPPGDIDAASRRDPTPIGSTQDETLGVGDVDVFRFEIPRSGTFEIRLSGTVQAQIEVRSRDGRLIASGRTMVEVPVEEGEVFVKVSAAPGAGSVGTGGYWLETGLIPDMTATSTPPTI